MFGIRGGNRYLVICWRSFLIVIITIVITACAKESTISGNTPAPQKDDFLNTVIPSIPFTIQLGAFRSSLRAERMTNGLQEKGLDAYFYEDKSGFSKVRFGRFNSRADAYERARALKAEGVIDTFYILQPFKKSKPTHKQSLKESYRKGLEKRLVETAKGFIGVPYRWGGTSAKNGFDCSGLTMTVYRLNGLELPRKASSQYRTGKPVSSHALKPADLIFFATNGDDQISHVGIYSGKGKFIHAPGSGKYIRNASLSNAYFKKHYRGARRYF